MAFGNGIIEINSGAKEISKFFCMTLLKFLNAEQDKTGKDMAELWDLRFGEAERGKCYYADKCSIHKRTIEKRFGEAVQLSLF